MLVKGTLLVFALLVSASSFATDIPLSPNHSLHGVAAVASTDTDGISFSNNSNCAAHISFFPTGFWKYHPELTWIGPQGDIGTSHDFFRFPSLPSGALVISSNMVAGSVVYPHYAYALGPRQQVYILMNDSVSGYTDNQGAIQVSWSIGFHCN